ncbi:glycoside hydrolase family 13 protein [Xylanibacter oryzae]|uniref:glycoside hydrolase family 13 protein n=1 Tax=Xylanibacter oryzae TaxID=185293 RepID=UPI0004B42021|nr:glycoside hydrolase family 13 protein [Xylanibacter oryzae]
MKKSVLLVSLLFSALAMQASIKIDRIEPTDWFVGMKDASLQLMVYGKDVKNANVTTSYAGVRVDSIVKLDSPNYLLVYLNLKGAKPGEITLYFANKGSKTKVKYMLKSRAMKGDEHVGFSSTDVLYMLMPDRFADGNVKNDQLKGMNNYKCDRTKPSLRHGGDLEGIRQHLDYFNQLGVTALWFTPVLENNSPDNNDYSTYHGYATTDYYNVDPRFGNNLEYKQLIDDAHKHGLKIVMDMIFNHCGFEHPWIKDIPSKDWFNSPEWLYTAGANGRDPMTGLANSAPKVNDKYKQTNYRLSTVLDPYASKFDKDETVNGWFVPTMPDLNQRNPHVMKYLIQNSEWWIETVGIDGIRMDTYPYADFDGMAEWMKTLNAEYPNFNIVGETWVAEPAYTATWQKDSRLAKKNSYLKTVMDFSFYVKLSEAKNEETNNEDTGLQRIYNSFVYDYLYPNPQNVMAFIENHDTDRFLGEGRNVNMLKQAYALLLTTRRIPQLYYGTEVLMNGTKTVTDGNVRKDFIGGFPGDARSAFTREGRTADENDMFDWLSRLLHWRQGNKVISEGSMIQFMPHNGIYAFARQKDGKTVLTILNGTTKTEMFDVKRYAEVIGSAKQGRDILTDRVINLDVDNITMQPRESLIIEL